MDELRVVAGTRLIFFENDPGIPPGCAHDPLAGLSLLSEGKAIGTAALKGNVGERDNSMLNIPAAQIQRAIQRASNNAPRALGALYAQHRNALTEVVNDFISGSISRSEARVRSSKLIREVYERVREVARRASAVEQLAHESSIYTEEEKWFRSAVREEVGYFHAFLEDIRSGKAQRIGERIEAYTRALRFMYEAARVQALPSNVLLYWTGPRKRDDPKVCEGCEYLMERSPYPKDMIPAVPRDGSTQCLVNCRHHILVRVARDLNEVVRRRQALDKPDRMLKRLREMKEDAGLGRRTPKTSGLARNPFSRDPLPKRTATRVPRRGL